MALKLIYLMFSELLFDLRPGPRCGHDEAGPGCARRTSPLHTARDLAAGTSHLDGMLYLDRLSARRRRETLADACHAHPDL